MAHLTLVGLSANRKRLLLVNDAGEEFTLAVDAALRSALRGEEPRPGQLEIRMDSALRPRDIQARIRAGETPEAVALAAKTTVEKIMPYSAPVLAERAHVADRAQRSSVRRRSSEGSGSLGGGRTLQETVATHLRAENIDPSTVEWDACRREDGRWTLTGTFSTHARNGTATFTFDLPGNYVTVEDENARWLVGEASPTRKVAAPDPSATTGTPRRRLSAVPADELPLGDDALEMVAEDHAAGLDDSPRSAQDEASGQSTSESAEKSPEEQSGQHTGEESPAKPAPAPPPPDDADSAPAAASPAAKEESPRRPVRKSRGRASVPSWDEIMFGGGSGD